MKKIIVASTVGVLALASVVAAKADKVEICHRTGSESNPFVLISVAQSAVKAHLGHGDSLLPEGATSCTGGGDPSPV